MGFPWYNAGMEPKKQLFPGPSGKDSAWALYEAAVIRPKVSRASHHVTEPFNRISMHGVRVELLEAQARSLSFRWSRSRSPIPVPMKYMKRPWGRPWTRPGEGVTRIVFGDLYLEDIRKYRESRAQGNRL